MFATRRWTVEWGIPVAARIPANESSGWAREKASRMAVIFRRTSKGVTDVSLGLMEKV